MNIKYRYLGILFLLIGLFPINLNAQEIDKNNVKLERQKPVSCERLLDKNTYTEHVYKNFNQLIEADDGWLFRTQFDLKNRFFLGDKTKTYLKRLHQSLRHYDTDFIVAMIPTRGITSHEKLNGEWANKYDVKKVTENYLKFLQKIRESGLRVVDIKDINKYDDFFYPRDNHWSIVGAKAMAEAVAKELKSLDFYDDATKYEYEIVTAKPTRNILWPNQFENVADQICGREESETDIKTFLKAQKITKNSLNEASLFGDDDLPQVVVLGTSNSTEIVPSYANFTGFLKKITGLDFINEAISGGSLKGSISKYFLHGNFKQQKPKAIIWEISAYYGYNQQEFYRELLPSIHGECNAENTIKAAQIDIPTNQEEFTIFDGLEELNLTDHNTYLALEFSDKTVRDIYVNFVHDNELRDTVHLQRKKRNFPKVNGKFFAEASAMLGTPLNEVVIDAKDATGNVKARLCKSPVQFEIPPNLKIDTKPAVVEKSFVDKVFDKFSYNIEPFDNKEYKTPEINLPSLDAYTKENILAKIPELKEGIVDVSKMKGSPPLRSFVFDRRLAEMRNIQDNVHPHAVHIRSGVYDFDLLKKKLFDTGALLDTPEGYLLTLPLAIYPEAAIVVEDLDKPLLLSQEKGSFIASAGDFFLINSTLTAWSEETSSPAIHEENNMDMFRPFIVTWDGSETYFVESVINNLGYSAAKSYGLTLSSNPIVQEKYGLSGKLPRPTGWFVENEFNNIYFGFYSYEADDVVIYKNRYIDNIVYGIDPHDFSERLIIANNYVTGAKQKHGIIISRSVNNSYIINNTSEYNKGSGFMLDRISTNNIVANNIARFNEGDGITLYESPDNILYNNRVEENAGTGIRIRNSWNVDVIGGNVTLNGAQAFKIYEDDLLHTDRNFQKDPVTVRTEAYFKDINVESNNGLLKTEEFTKITFDDLNWKKGSMTSRNFYGDLESSESDLNKMVKKSKNFTLISDNEE